MATPLLGFGSRAELDVSMQHVGAASQKKPGPYIVFRYHAGSYVSEL
uniref:Uncharacterized protein n=1 Tax=Setaria italica TaxID=4555 RepID=K3YNP3_SETIT